MKILNKRLEKSTSDRASGHDDVDEPLFDHRGHVTAIPTLNNGALVWLKGAFDNADGSNGPPPTGRGVHVVISRLGAGEERDDNSADRLNPCPHQKLPTSTGGCRIWGYGWARERWRPADGGLQPHRQYLPLGFIAVIYGKHC